MGGLSFKASNTVSRLLQGLLSVLFCVCLAGAAQAREDAAYHAKLDQTYGLIASAPFAYDANEVDRYGEAALNLTGDDRLYALWRVLYAYKNDQNGDKLQAWHDRISRVALQQNDSNLDLLARFMSQAYENETNGFNVLSERDWNTYLTAPDAAIQNIAMLERERQLQYQRQWAAAIDMGEELVLRLQHEGNAANGMLVVAQQTQAYNMLKVSDFNAYADHMLAVARLSRTDAFFVQKMDMVYDLAYFASQDNDTELAQKLQKLYAGNVAKYNVADLKPWSQELCATVAEGANDSRAVVDCLRESSVVTGKAEGPHDAMRLMMLIRAYAHLHDAAAARTYMAKLDAMPAAMAPQREMFSAYINAFLKASDGQSAEAFNELDAWTTNFIRLSGHTRAMAVQDMYKALRSELERKKHESELLTKQVQMGNMLLGAAVLIALLLGVICFGIVLWVRRMRRMQRNLAAAHEHAEAANAAKTRFLAVMSHELRTPLNGVLGMAQALQKDDLTDSQAEQVEVLIDSGKTLMVLLNDVLDMSRIEAGKIELAPTTASMKDMIARVINTYSSLTQGRQISLRSEFSEGADKAMSFDVLRVYQCLSNLVSNALKFTEKGSVRLIVSVEPIIPDGGYMVRVEVRDTGIGMSRAQMDKLFEAYAQADASTARKYGGTGLGLNISRRLAELMGGTLGVTSEEGKGSSFVMTFKAGEVEAPTIEAEAVAEDAAPAPVQPLAEAEGATGKRILLVDDHPVNRKVARLFLEPFGFVITEAVDGQAALDLDMSRFDLVLMDLNMPRLGGLEATKRFRATEKHGHHLPIVALTADAMPDQVDACHAAGMDAHISKPILMDRLIETVNAMLKQHARRNAA